jgi:hypothetical protein
MKTITIPRVESDEINIWLPKSFQGLFFFQNVIVSRPMTEHSFRKDFKNKTSLNTFTEKPQIEPRKIIT